MPNDWFEKLQSPLRPERSEGWNQARLSIMRGQRVLSPKERQQLMQFYRQETDPDVKQAASDTLLELAFAGPAAAPEVSQRRRKRPENLADWLWSWFKGRSAVLSVSDPRQLRRDESTLFAIGRVLPQAEFPDVQAHSVELYDPHWQQLRVLEPVSLCLVGRLGLYGSQALKWWSPLNPRFSFLMHERPGHLLPGDLDPEYHCIRERLPDGSDRFYRTRNEDGRRTDYCLVSRYVVTDGVRETVIVNCAGPTSLGTLGAVTWAANELPLPARPDGDPIPLPKSVRYASRLEALLEVTADITNGTWSPNPGRLISLRVDDWLWSEELREWRAESPGQIRLVLQDGDPDRPVAIYLDGKEPKMDHDGQAFRLMARLASNWETCSEDGIALGDLAKDAWIWGGRSVGEDSAHSRLKQVKQRYLHDALVVGKSNLLQAEIVIEKSTESDAFARRVQAEVEAANKKEASSSANGRARRRKRPR